MTVPAERPVRVLVADDHAAIRAGLRLLLEAAEGIEVVAEAADGHAAVANARALRPDVVLMDLRMPGTDGVEATRIITTEGLADVLVLTTFDLDEYVHGALDAGAAGFLLKSAEPADLLRAVRQVAAGEGVLAPEVTRRVLARIAGTPPAPSDAVAPDPAAREADPRLDGLTPREVDVLAALGRGLSNQDISAELVISEATTKTHVSRVLAKLQVPSRMQAAVVARRTGLA
ncbi:LuxR family two component transcriptional regulator [Isoptericola sp. CG 20/1183]|uniref:LuxR family two component transcriptional regulator n=1 Tax=Isoptericola halotolerans TaxID=300560 RepID=A0ABX5ELC7_9MICO|nr:LuxR family two component transcriptional regulator [Isoptericola sp. CG 20/1183]PRZ10134.1 LuxR family two component transcriptional regulator [Isoptericola halotolerans]